MSYNISSFRYFLKQVKKPPVNSRRLIYDKIQLLKQNPFRFKQIHTKTFSKVFRIRFSLEGQNMRLIYLVIDPDVIIVCMITRKSDYKQLEKYLKKVKNEL